MLDVATIIKYERIYTNSLGKIVYANYKCNILDYLAINGCRMLGCIVVSRPSQQYIANNKVFSRPIIIVNYFAIYWYMLGANQKKWTVVTS